MHCDYCRHATSPALSGWSTYASGTLSPSWSPVVTFILPWAGGMRHAAASSAHSTRRVPADATRLCRCARGRAAGARHGPGVAVLELAGSPTPRDPPVAWSVVGGLARSGSRVGRMLADGWAAHSRHGGTSTQRTAQRLGEAEKTARDTANWNRGAHGEQRRT